MELPVFIDEKPVKLVKHSLLVVQSGIAGLYSWVWPYPVPLLAAYTPIQGNYGLYIISAF